MGRNTANIIIVNNYTDTAKSEHESVMLCYAYLSIFLQTEYQFTLINQ